MVFALFAYALGFLELAFVFYPVVVLLIILSIWCLPQDLDASAPNRRDRTGSPTWALLFNVLMFALVIYHFGIDVSSWKRWLPLTAIYLAIGVAWSSGKWWSFCGQVRDRVKDVVDRFDKTVRTGEDNDEDVALSFMRCMFEHSSLRKYKESPGTRHNNTEPMAREDVIDIFVPLVTAHKGAVLMWLFCWPMSILKWALADMLQDVYNAVFAAIKGWFQKIAKKRFSGI